MPFMTLCLLFAFSAIFCDFTQVIVIPPILTVADTLRQQNYTEEE